MKFRPLHEPPVVKRIDGADKARSGIVVVDKGYIHEQANVALKTFLAPLSGIYAAAFGPIGPPAEETVHSKGGDL